MAGNGRKFQIDNFSIPGNSVTDAIAPGNPSREIMKDLGGKSFFFEIFIPSYLLVMSVMAGNRLLKKKKRENSQKTR